MKTRSIFLVLLFSVIALRSVCAQWSSDPAVNSAVCSQSEIQTVPQIVDDGAGGCIICWSGNRNGGALLIQRLNASGLPQWTASGVVLTNMSVGTLGYIPQMISDGSGGAFIAWEGRDSSSIANNTLGDVFAQRIDHSGKILWTSGGIPICRAPWNQTSAQIISDGAGGVIIAWSDNRTNDNHLAKSFIYTQRVNGSGSILWKADGNLVNTDTSSQTFWHMTSDGTSGAILIWTEIKTPGGNPNVYAERIDSTGNSKWAPDGVQVSSSISENPAIVTDGHNGAIIAWTDTRAGAREIYLQKITSSGSAGWPAGGIDIGGFASAQQHPMMVEDDAGGAIVAWMAGLKVGSGIFAQKVNSSGIQQWPVDTSYKGGFRGLNICPKPNLPTGGSGTYITLGTNSVVKDGSGGAIVTIADATSADATDIYAQRIGTAGDLLWGAQAAALCTAPKGQSFPVVECDGAGKAILAWQDNRNDATNSQIFAQRIDALGVLGQGGAIPIPVLVSPPDGTLLPDTNVTLLWGKVNGAVSYQLRCGTDSTFNSQLLVDQSNLFDTTYFVPSLTFSTIYYWDVRSYENSAHQKGNKIQSTPGEWSAVRSFRTPSTINSVTDVGLKMTGIRLYPNPTAGDATISYTLAKRSDVKIELLSTLGQNISTLRAEPEDTGTHFLLIDTHLLAGGNYFIHFMIDGVQTNKKLEIIH